MYFAAPYPDLIHHLQISNLDPSGKPSPILVLNLNLIHITQPFEAVKAS